MKINIVDLKLGQKVWYSGISCIIDCLLSGDIYKSTSGSTIRIYPENRKTHLYPESYRRDNVSTSCIIQNNGKWCDITDEHLSLTPPPKPVTWKNLKSGLFGQFDFNKGKAIAKLLESGETLEVRCRSFNDTLVHKSKKHGNIVTTPKNKKLCDDTFDVPVNLALSFMLFTTNDDKWYVV